MSSTSLDPTILFASSKPQIGLNRVNTNSDESESSSKTIPIVGSVVGGVVGIVITIAVALYMKSSRGRVYPSQEEEAQVSTGTKTYKGGKRVYPEQDVAL
jgi:hypothetical protein